MTNEAKTLRLDDDDFETSGCLVETNENGTLVIIATIEPGKFFYFPTPFVSDIYHVAPAQPIRFYVIERKAPTHILIQAETSQPMRMKFVGRWK